MVTIFPVSTFLSGTVAVADEVESVTTSLPCLPTSAADPRTNCGVTFVPALYVRLLAVMPVTVSVLAVMFAEDDGCCSE